MYFAWFSALAECGARGAAPHQVTRSLAIQAEAAQEACRGAAEEIAMSGDLTCGTSRWTQMARQKTAALISAACQVGSVLSGAGDGQTAALAEFGEHLGLAFQIRDDLLPYDRSTRTVMGKPADSDIRNHRPTYPLLLAWERASPSQRDDLAKALTTTTDPARAPTRLRTLLGTTGALATAHEIADRHEQLACHALDGLPRGPHTDALTRLAHPTPDPPAR